VRDLFRSIMELLFEAAALIIDTLRTFFLVVLAILGPIAFAISVWDGFQSTLTQWVCRYVQVYLWLPVSDLFSTILARIQILMLQNDITELQNNPAFSIDASNGVYIVFLVIGIVGYFTIPTVSGWIIQAGGMGSYNRSINNMASLAGKRAAGAAGAVAGHAALLCLHAGPQHAGIIGFTQHDVPVQRAGTLLYALQQVRKGGIGDVGESAHGKRRKRDNGAGS